MPDTKIPDGWTLSTLGEVIVGKPQYGLTARSSTERGKILYLRISDITDEGELKVEDLHYIDVNFAKVSKYKLHENDFLIARSGSVGRVYLHKDLGKPSVFASYLIRFRLDSNKVLPKFVFYWGLSPPFKREIETKRKIVAQPNINAKDYCRFRLPVPPLETQRKIISVLERAHKFKQKREQANQLTNKITQSVFLKMFGDPLVNPYGFLQAPLSQVAEINPPKKEISSMPNDLEVTFLPMAAVSEDGRIIERQTRKLSEVKKGFTYFREGDVLFAKITPCMENGKGTIARQLKNGLGFGSTEFYVFRPSSNAVSEWLFYCLRYPLVRKLAEESMTGTAGQRRVPKSFFDRLDVPIPPREIQEKFAAVVRRIELTWEKQKQSAMEINELFHSLMQRAFTGQLVS